MSKLWWPTPITLAIKRQKQNQFRIGLSYIKFCLQEVRKCINNIRLVKDCKDGNREKAKELAIEFYTLSPFHEIA